MQVGIGTGIAVAVSPVEVAQPATGVVAAMALWGSETAPERGNWRPQLASGAVEPIASIDEVMDDLGPYRAQLSEGGLVFSGAPGAPDGARLRLTGASGRSYEVAISVVPGRRDIGKLADIEDSWSIPDNLGLTLVVRQNAQLPRRTRDTGQRWLHATQASGARAGQSAPITVVGEGAHVDGEYHIAAWELHPSDRMTFRRLKFGSDPATSKLVLFGNYSPRVIWVDQCHFECRYAVDDPSEDWSEGFGSRPRIRGIYTNTNSVHGLKLTDNVFRGLYLSAEVIYNHYLWTAGNYFEGPYFDYRKTSFTPAYGGGDPEFSGGNLYANPLRYSAGETPATAPHGDMDQRAGGGAGRPTVHAEANIKWHTTDAAIQCRFYSDRSSGQERGYAVDAAGELFVANTLRLFTISYPDNTCLRNILALPSQRAALPLGATTNAFFYGTRKSGDGGEVGVQRMQDCSFRAVLVDDVLRNFDRDETNVIAQAGWEAADYAARLVHWGAEPDDAPSFAEAWEYGRPIPGSDFETVSPWAHVQPAPAGAPQSGYWISDTLRPWPVLTNLSVAQAGGVVSFDCDTNIDQLATIFWSVTAAEETSAEAVRDLGTPANPALDFGFVYRSDNTAGQVSGQGRTALPPGDYWLNLAQWNGLTKVTRQSLPFTVV